MRSYKIRWDFPSPMKFMLIWQRWIAKLLRKCEFGLRYGLAVWLSYSFLVTRLILTGMCLFQQREKTARIERLSQVSLDNPTLDCSFFKCAPLTLEVITVNYTAAPASIRQGGAALATLPMTCTLMLPSKKTCMTYTIKWVVVFNRECRVITY